MPDQSTPAELAERLKAYVTPGATHVAVDETFIVQCIEEASALVAAAIGTANVPEEIVARATVEAGSELFHRRQAPNGISQFAAPDGAPVRIARDPMNAARAILAPFLPLGFA